MDETSTMSGGEAIVRSVQAHGIDTVFGIPGAQIYPLFDAMHRLGIRVVAPRHEQAAAYMAMGAANSTGKPSCFAVVPGPGILNTTAALCTAMGTCSPVLGLTGQVPSEFLGKGRGHLHELGDQPGMLRTLIKDAVFINDASTTSSVMRGVFGAMVGGRPGPVTVEMCWDTMAQPHTVEPVVPLDLATPTRPALDGAAVELALEALRSARRPMIMCGKGAQHAAADVQELAELLGAPVVAFRSGRGVVAEDHRLGVSSVAARLLYDKTDLVLGLGSRLEMLSMRWSTPGRNEPRAPGGPTLVRVDVDPDALDSYPADIAIEGDTGEFCRAVVAALRDKRGVGADAALNEDITNAKRTAERLVSKVEPQVSILRAIRDVLPRDGFFVPELSQLGFTSYFAFPVLAPRTYVTEGYQGTLGFGFPTALGVKVANPSRAVVSVTGDGGFLFGLQELATAATYNIAAVTVVHNNHSYGNVRRDQLTNYGGRVTAAELKNPDFVALSHSFGVDAVRVHDADTLRTAFDHALSTDRPWVIELETPVGAESNPWEFIHMKTAPAAGSETPDLIAR